MSVPVLGLCTKRVNFLYIQYLVNKKTIISADYIPVSPNASFARRDVQQHYLNDSGLHVAHTYTGLLTWGNKLEALLLKACSAQLRAMESS